MKYGIEKFMSKVQKTKTCWLWTGSKTLRNYGRCEWGKYKLAHRVSYELFNGKFNLNMQVNHSCDNPPCVNPSHLWLGTQKENLRDAARKERLPMQKLTYRQAYRIRKIYKLGNINMVYLGKRFGVSNQSICDIVNNISYI